MKFASVAVVAAAVAIAPRPAHASSCTSIHAAKIAVESKLADCTAAKITSANQTAASGANLGAAASACIGLTADECAAYFVAHPERGLIENTATTHSYTAYHFGAEHGLRLPDGTRPMLYYKPAPGGDNPHFNSWVFFLYGGAGMCVQDVVQKTDGPGWSTLSSQGADCFDKLAYASQAETKAGTGFGRVRHADFSSYGILGDNPANTVFAKYNRVVITKSNDYYIGDVTKYNVDVGNGFSAQTMQLHGNAIVKRAMAFFTSPVQGGADFNDARRVLFVASSSGTNSVHRADEWRMAAMSLAPDAYVGYMANSSAVTPDSFTLEEFDDAPCGSIYANNCGATYDNPPHGITPATGLVTDSGRRLGFSHAAFSDYVPIYWNGTDPAQLAPGNDAHSLASISAFPDSVLDASCLAAEPPADQWKCRSPIYVMFNHLRTPLFIGHSLHDTSNIDGVIKGIASRDADGSLPRWNQTTWPAGSPYAGQEPHATLARFHFSSWVTDRNDPTGAVGESRYAGPIGVWAPLCNHHEPEKSDHSFLSIEIGSPANNSIGRVTLERALVQWFEGRVKTVRIDGFLDSETVGTPTGCQ